MNTFEQSQVLPVQEPIVDVHLVLNKPEFIEAVQELGHIDSFGGRLFHILEREGYRAGGSTNLPESEQLRYTIVNRAGVEESVISVTNAANQIDKHLPDARGVGNHTLSVIKAMSDSNSVKQLRLF
ncbi:hypothetical protein H7171_03260 [Candidatus Saccharibacteria bacterium]|nr:hypothetical protein [Candidatus Saccharibacteria bacterium]